MLRTVISSTDWPTNRSINWPTNQQTN